MTRHDHASTEHRPVHRIGWLRAAVLGPKMDHLGLRPDRRGRGGTGATGLPAGWVTGTGDLVDAALFGVDCGKTAAG